MISAASATAAAVLRPNGSPSRCRGSELRRLLGNQRQVTLLGDDVACPRRR